MAVTASKLIRRALRLIGALDSSEALPADMAADALDVLNAMLAEWHEAGIGLPDYQFDSVTDSLATDAADSEAIAYQLAIRIAPEYGLEISQLAMASANEAMSRLRLRYFQPGRVDFSELPTISVPFDIEVG